MTERDEATEATKREGHASERARAHFGPAHAKYLERGALVGRYVIVDKLGEGGMGVVYSAFDPELDRKVAIKLLTARGGEGSTSGGDQAWLLREAQALARLQHPNVVAVHDVGTLAGDQVFVAMEHVDGTTMRGWLKASSRTWREVLPVMRAAGAGLAAAHAAGLVHRDFKPENVLVGKDGRVRVMDFGLAKREGPRASGLAPRPESDPPVDLTEVRSPKSDALTLAGHVVGTPAYMAPEIHDGTAADARADQFAFGVTLAEALYHVRPFERKELAASRSAPPKPKLPADARVPAALEHIVVRALALDPAQRFASMTELLAALAVDPFTKRRRAAVAGGMVVAIAAVAVVAAVASRGHSPQCEGIDKRLAGVWDAPTSKTVHDAFVATKLPFAERSYHELAAALDGYAKTWVDTAVGSCKATRVSGEQTEKVQTLRQSCLDERLEGLAAVTRALADPTRSVVEKSAKVIEELEPLADCSNVLALEEPNLPPPEVIPKLRELNAKLADAKAQVIMGNYINAGGNAIAISKLAREIHYAPAEAVAEQIRGVTLMVAMSYQDAERAFIGAALSGLSSKHDDIAANSALSVAMVDVEGLGKPGEARVWLEVAQAAAKRYGADPMTEMRIDELAGVVAAHNGDVPSAIAAHEKALAEGTAFFGHDNPLLWEHEQIYATSLTNAQEYAKAVPHYERALELRSRVVGMEHMDIAVILSDLGICYMHLRDPRAKETLEHSLQMREKLFGKANPIVVAPLDNLGSYLRQAGDTAGALAALERALRLSALMPGKDAPPYQQVATDYALTLSDAGRAAEARALLDDVLAIEDRTHSPIKPTTETARAEVALATKAWPDAIAHGLAAIEGFETAGGQDNPELWRPLSDVARAYAEVGRRGDAQALYERSLAIAEKLHLHDAELAPTREGLAALTARPARK